MIPLCLLVVLRRPLFLRTSSLSVWSLVEKFAPFLKMFGIYEEISFLIDTLAVFLSTVTRSRESPSNNITNKNE